jgi:hypothetical protein
MVAKMTAEGFVAPKMNSNMANATKAKGGGGKGN